jgi:hypothetical protein
VRSRLSVACWRCQFWADCTTNISERKFPTGTRDGCTEAIMLAHGFTIKQMVELIHAGLATAHSQRVIVGRRTIEVARVKITEAGRQALA